MNRKTLIISGFPCIGKSTLFKNSKNLIISDSDSSKFSKDFFPDNYINYIKSKIGKSDLLLVSSHKEVRDKLTDEGIPFIICYPELSGYDREIYLDRLRKRSGDEFAKVIEDNWDSWINEIKLDKIHTKFVIDKPDHFLSDFTKEINNYLNR